MSRAPGKRRRLRLAMPWPRTRAGRRGGAALLGLLLLGLLYRCADDGSERRHWPRAQILAAIRAVESGGMNPIPDGDGGLAIGPYQIHFVYWLDARSFAPEIGGQYQDCRGAEYAERVIDAYMRRYARAAWEQGEAETIARVHNGGPRGPQNPKTDGYWQKVRRKLP